MKIFLLLFLITHVFAQEVEVRPANPTQESVQEKKEVKKEVKTVVQETHTSQENRSKSLGSLMVGYELIATWVPFKKTVSYTHIFNEKWNLEFEYSWSRINFPFYVIDIGEISEKRYSLLARRFVGNSFHFIFGAQQSDLRVKVGDDILRRIGSSSINAFEVRSLGAAVGIGNRWQWQNGFTLGVDWFRMNVPLFDKRVDSDILNKIQNNNDLNDVKNVITKFKNIPTFVLLGISLGYTF